MTKQKKSFFEKLTGIQKIDDESEIEINNSSELEETIQKDDSYDFPKKEEKESSNNFFEEPEEEFDPPEKDFEEKISKAEEQTASPFNQEKPSKVEENQTEDPEIEAEGQLTIDVYQTDRDIVIKSTIAGVKPEDLDIDINSEMVTVKGKRSQEEEIDSENYYYQECYWGPFSRSIVLPVEIITEKAEATMKNGILTIRLPKMEVAKTRKLQVRGF